MINKYVDFITESQIQELIIEGSLDASIEFLNRLKYIKDKNKVADSLYNLFSSEVFIDKDLSQNYLDTTEKEDFITFLSDKRAEDIEDDDDSPYVISGRGEIKVGRFARAFLTLPEVKSELGPLTFTDKDYEDFVNLYKSLSDKNENRFEIVRGKSIKKYYLEDIYAYGEKGQLGNSCMKYNSCQEYLNFYSKNKKSCNLLVYLNPNGELLGRALVWKLKKSPCDAKYFMDRIYTASDSDVLKFQRYADEQGWMYKLKQSSDNINSYFFKYKGVPIVGEVVVDLEKSNFDKYPFLDTLASLNKKEKYITNIPFKKCLFLYDTHGGYDYCYTCGGSGKLDKKKCPDCVNLYKNDLKMLLDEPSLSTPEQRVLAAEELKRLSS
jgi:hypothetical protein